MNETTKKAVETYEKLYDEATKAYNAKRKAEREAHEAWKIYDAATPSALSARIAARLDDEKIAAIYEEFKKADERQKAAADRCRIAEAARAAAGMNAARAAAEELKEAIKATPEKYNTPTNYKKFKKQIETLFDSRFTVTTSYYTVTITFYPYYTRYSAYITTTEHENGAINPEKINTNTFYIASAAEIKKEAKQAAKDAKKIEELQKEAERKSGEIKAKYKTDIKNYLPLLHTLPIEGAKFYN